MTNETMLNKMMLLILSNFLTTLNKMSIIFFSIDNLLLLYQWKYYQVKKNPLIQELFSMPPVSADIFEPHGFLFFIIFSIKII